MTNNLIRGVDETQPTQETQTLEPARVEVTKHVLRWVALGGKLVQTKPWETWRKPNIEVFSCSQ